MVLGMTKKHFIALAAEIAKISNLNERKAAARVVVSVARDDNARFDTNRFLEACCLKSYDLD